MDSEKLPDCVLRLGPSELVRDAFRFFFGKEPPPRPVVEIEYKLPEAEKPPSEFMTAQEVSDLVGVHVKTIRRWTRLGLFPHVVLPGKGHDYRYLRTSVTEWARKRELGNPK